MIRPQPSKITLIVIKDICKGDVSFVSRPGHAFGE